jgi:hypothetical protein
LELDRRGTGLGPLEDERLKRLIWGWHGSQTLFRPVIRRDSKVADVGFNFAQLTLPLAELVGSLTLIDISDDRFEYVRRLTGKSDARIELIKHDYGRGSLSSRKFDLIVCTATIEYLPGGSRERFLQSMIDNLDAGSLLLIDMRDPWKWKAMLEFMWYPSVALGWVFPYLKGEGILPVRRFTEWASDVRVWLSGFLKYHLQSCMRRLHVTGFDITPTSRGLVSGKEAVSKPNELDAVLRRLGMVPVEERLIDDVHYQLARNLEGLFGSGTFLANPFWVGLYRKR